MFLILLFSEGKFYDLKNHNISDVFDDKNTDKTYNIKNYEIKCNIKIKNNN